MQRSTTHWTWLPGLVVLAVEPVRWLVRTWTDPAYDSDGAWVALLCLGVLVRCVTSGPAERDDTALRRALWLWLGAAAVRLLGRVLDVDHIAALALVADVGALALLLRTSRRPWPVAPWALAGLFAMALPVQHALQQLASWPLRVASTVTAASVLRGVWPELRREGTVLLLPDGPLSVALPCSGASGLVLLGTLALAIACRRRLDRSAWLLGAAAVLAGAWLTNTLRIVILALGPTEQWLLEPAHTVVGLVALAAGAALPLWVARRLPERVPESARHVAASLDHRWWRLMGLAFSAAALWVVQAPHRPLDVSADPRTAQLPAVLGPWLGQPGEPTEQEQRYFKQYGGELQRVRYDTGAGHTVLLVSTTAPVRHLHSPRACLQGAGHTVERLGLQPGAPEPTVVWRSVDPDGHAWRVQTTFLSAAGTTADSASEVVWRWLAEPGVPWMLVERVTPWEACQVEPGRCEALDHHLFASLEASSL